MNILEHNRILSALPERELKLLRYDLEPVELPLNLILSQKDRPLEKLYFPTAGIISLLAVLDNGSTTEVGMVGQEGVVGALGFLGEGVFHAQAVVQLLGTAMAIKTQALRPKYDRCQTLQKLLLRHSLKLFNQVSLCSACNNHHSVKQRTARWLLMMDDRSDRHPLIMTQQLLAQMLGVRRTGVTEIASQMQEQGIIQYRRGKIEILDRSALEQIACQCYQILKQDNLDFR